MNNCPQCGSDKLYKNGRSQNKMRSPKYKCKECNYQFTPLTGLIPTRPVRNILPDDLKCCGQRLHKDGYYQGQQKYRCSKCGKTYIEYQTE